MKRVEVSEDWLTLNRLTFPVFGRLRDFSYSTKSQTSAEFQGLLGLDLSRPAQACGDSRQSVGKQAGDRPGFVQQKPLC